MNLHEGTPTEAAKVLTQFGHERSAAWVRQQLKLTNPPFRFRSVDAPHLSGGKKFIIDLDSLREWIEAKKPRKLTLREIFESDD